MRLDEPTPKRLFTALKASITGAARVTAAFWTESFSRLTKKVSARLYITVTSELITVGTASEATALPSGADSNRYVFLSISCNFLHLHPAERPAQQLRRTGL